MNFKELSQKIFASVALVLAVFLIVPCVSFSYTQNIVFAADEAGTATTSTTTSTPTISSVGGWNDKSGLSKMSSLHSDFGSNLTKLYESIRGVSQKIAVIMTVTGGIMIALGLNSGMSTFWKWVLGIGLAMNFGDFLYAIMPNPQSEIEAGKSFLPVPEGMFEIKGEAEKTNILSSFMYYYLNGIIKPGALTILPYAVQLCMILTILDSSIRLALDLINGDKIMFMVKTILKTGLYIFLMMNWITGWQLMPALSSGFQEIGYMAGGASSISVDVGADKATDSQDKSLLAADSIVNNGFLMFTAVKGQLSPSHPIDSLVVILFAIVMLICIVLTALEMFMARFEFYTMSLITIPLLAFGCIDRFKFLAEKSILAMFNLAVKVCVIAFIQTLATRIIVDFIEAFKNVKDIGEGIFMLCVQGAFVAVLILLIVRKIPALVQGLLQGSPSLGGGDMMGSIKSVANTAGGTAGAIYGAVKAASGAKGGAGAKMSAFAKGLGGAALDSITDAIPGGSSFKQMSRNSQGHARSGNSEGKSADLESKMAENMGGAVGSSVAGPIGGIVGSTLASQIAEASAKGQGKPLVDESSDTYIETGAKGKTADGKNATFVNLGKQGAGWYDDNNNKIANAQCSTKDSNGNYVVSPPQNGAKGITADGKECTMQSTGSKGAGWYDNGGNLVAPSHDCTPSSGGSYSVGGESAKSAPTPSQSVIMDIPNGTKGYTLDNREVTMQGSGTENARWVDNAGNTVAPATSEYSKAVDGGGYTVFTSPQPQGKVTLEKAPTTYTEPQPTQKASQLNSYTLNR